MSNQETEDLISEDYIASVINAVSSGLTVGDICNIAPETLEGLYSLAYNLYNAKDYKNAETVFQALCMYKHNEYRFWMGLAGSRQENNNLKGAIDAYSLAGFSMQLKNPEPFYFAAQCFVKLGDKESAIGSIQSLLTMVDEKNKAHLAVQEKAEALLKALESL